MSDTKINDGGSAFPVPESGPHYAPAGMQGMSLRQYAAIKLRVPNSGTGWLDKMIIESKRDELAGQALAGLLARDLIGSSGGSNAIQWANVRDDDSSRMPRLAYQYSDAMLAASNAK